MSAQIDPVARDQFADLLERNGYHTAAAAVHDGRPFREATGYVLADMRENPPHYDDDEERWLREYVALLHETDPATLTAKP